MASKGDRRVKLDILQAYGSNCSLGLRDCVAIVEDDTRKILYPVGKYFALKNYDRSESQFIKVSENVEQIICMSVSPNKKLLAVSQQVNKDDYPQISIYNIKQYLTKGDKEKTFRYSDTKSNQFIAIAFSMDSRFLVCLTNEPEFQLVFLDIARMKPIGQTILGFEATRLTINPKENHLVGISGLNNFKILRVQENTFKQLNDIQKLPQNQNFTDHAWFDEQRIIIVNDRGEIWIIQDYNLTDYKECGFGNDKGESIVAVSTFSKGFMIGSTNGKFALWIKEDEADDQIDKDNFVLHRVWQSERISRIQCIDISLNEELIAVAFKSNDIATFEMNSILPSTTETLEFGRNNNLIKKQVNFEYIYNGFHNGSITSMDICLQRPLIVTCSKYDSTIRIWNYINFKCELARKFHVGEDSSQDISPLLSVAFHPSGYYIAAGYTDKLRFFHVMNSQLRLYREVLLKGSTQIKFSNGGHLVACAYPKQKTTLYDIQIYNSYTCEPTLFLKGHANMITDIKWSMDDTKLYTCGLDGCVHEYSTISQDINNRTEQFVCSNNKISSLILIPREKKDEHLTISNQNQVIMVCGEDANKKCILHEMKGGQNSFQRAIPQPGQAKISQLCYFQSLHNFPGIIAGTSLGQIKIFHQFSVQIPFESIQAHYGAIQKIKVSPDGRYVFSSGEDGALFIFQVTELNSDGTIYNNQDQKTEDLGEDLQMGGPNRELNSKAMIVDENLADVVLVQRSEIDNYLNEQKKLKAELDDLENKMEIKEQDDKYRLEKEKKEAEEHMNNEINRWNKRYEEIKQEKLKIEKESNQLLKNMENNHLKAIEELEALYEKKLAFENEKYMQQEYTLIEERMKNEEKIRQIEKKHSETIELLQKEFREKFESAHRVYDSTKQTADELRLVYEERLAQQEEEHELEVQELKSRHSNEIDELKTEVAKLKKDNELLKQDSSMANSDKERLEKSERERRDEIERLRLELQNAQQRIELLEKDLKERDETLKKKEKKIYEYKYKVNDLQKSKHVLSFRTTEMRKSLEPKNNQIEKLKEELFKLENEFEGMLKTTQLQTDKMKKMQNQIDSLNKSLKDQIELTQKKEILIQKITMDIYNCVQRDPKEWSNDVRKLYHTYVLNQEVKKTNQDARGVEEMNRQITHLEKSIDQIHESSQKMIKRRELDNRKKMMENAGLIFDLNEIRKKNKQYEQEINTKETDLQHEKNENKKLKLELEKIRNQLTKYMKSDDFDQVGSLQQSKPLNQSQQLERKDSDKKFMMDIKLQRKQDSSNIKGKVYKGSNYDSRTLSTFDKAKMMDLMVELENLTQKILNKETLIKNVKMKIRRHINLKGCHDLEAEIEAIDNFELNNNENHQMLQRPGSQSQRVIKSINQQENFSHL